MNSIMNWFRKYYKIILATIIRGFTMKVKVGIILTLILFYNTPLSADFYTYVDKKGNEWTVDRKELIPEQYKDSAIFLFPSSKKGIKPAKKKVSSQAKKPGKVKKKSRKKRIKKPYRPRKQKGSYRSKKSKKYKPKSRKGS